MEESALQHLEDLTVKYLSSRATPGEIAELKSIIGSDPASRRRFMQMREVWFSMVSRGQLGHYDTEAAWQRFRARVAASENAGRGRRRLLLRAARYAAAVAVIVMVGIFAYHRGGDSLRQQFADISVEAPLGSRTSVVLPDGTKVWLNAGSTLSYSQGFGVDGRSVNISGEGYFEVARNEALPFVVSSKDLQVRVLGTVFNICDYPDDMEAAVSLKEGSVEFVNMLSDNTMVMKPGDRVALDKSTGEARMITVSTDNYSQWTQGQLFFDEELLADIARRLERSYCVEIDIASDSLARQRFYGSFVKNSQRIEDILDALAETQGISYVIDNRRITLY